MAITVSKVPLFTSGEIKFSSLRDSFRQSGTTIKASELLRDTLVTVEQRDPVVPDATENSTISTGSNWSTSQFRNSIKYYDVIQSSTDTNMILQNQSWNGNLDKSIRKLFTVTGTIGATSGPALTLSANAYNLQINISGGIYGTGGSSGGGSGGDAMSISSNGKVIINVQSSANIFGGGGGGRNGSQGANGPTGTCLYYTFFYTGYQCGSVPSCGSAVTIGGAQAGGGCNCTKKGCKNTLYRSYCRGSTYYQVRGGFGGAGGSGGRGRGYDYSGSLSGGGGSPGESPFCPNPNGGSAGSGGIGSYGGTGESGQSGGDWGQSSTGAAGRAIRGATYEIRGNTGTDNIKGGY